MGRNPLRVYLTGFMASGKSTVGPLLANELGYAFVDLDEQIEARAGRSIPSIFDEEGEAGFREREARQLRATARREGLVVALGGGALVAQSNRRFALDRGTVVYLKASPAALTRRLQQNDTERPLLQDDEGHRLSNADLRARIEAMLADRAGYYRQAHITIDTSHQRVEETVAAVLSALRRQGAEGRGQRA